MARAEPTPARREHDDADARVRSDTVQRRLQLVDERARERIELAGPIQRHRGDSLGRVDKQQFLGLRRGIRCHGSLKTRRRAGSGDLRELGGYSEMHLKYLASLVSTSSENHAAVQ